jgi:Protein of unknown function (DUF4242)
MTSPGAFDSDRTAFLVERYLPPAAADGLPASVARAARLCADVSRSGLGVHYLYSVYLPTEDTCFCLFRAQSSDTVREVNAEADFALDRITNAVLLFSGDSRTPDSTHQPDQSPSIVQSRKG